MRSLRVAPMTPRRGSAFQRNRNGRIYAGINSVASKTDAERIQALQDLCTKLDALQKQAAEICEKATAEIERARRNSQRERRSKDKKVKLERRR